MLLELQYCSCVGLVWGVSPEGADTSLVPRPSHLFNGARNIKKVGGPGDEARLVPRTSALYDGIILLP